MGGRILAERRTEAAPAGEKKKEKPKEAGVNYVSSIPKSPAMHDLGLVVNPPEFQMKKDGETRPIKGGHPIAEVFGMHVVSGKKSYNKIHGTVWIKRGGLGRFDIFRRSRLNPQIVHRRDSLELIGPSTALPAYDPIFMGCHLMEGRHDIVGMRMAWDPDYGALDVVYNEPYNGSKSSVTWHMSYVVYGEAVVATIEIVFEARSSVGICGTITAFSNMLPDWRTVLFCKERDAGEYQSVEEGQQQVLPLLRYVAAVPIYRASIQKFEEWKKRKMNGCLKIDMNLMNVHDEGTIAKGVLKFPAQNFGEYVGTIASKYGVMQVKLSFVGIFEHLPREYFIPPGIQTKKSGLTNE